LSIRLLYEDANLIGIAEPPRWPEAEGFDDRMSRLAEVPGRVVVLRLLAAGDVAAGRAEPEGDPRCLSRPHRPHSSAPGVIRRISEM
jgi:hypothetical protein